MPEFYPWSRRLGDEPCVSQFTHTFTTITVSLTFRLTQFGSGFLRFWLTYGSAALGGKLNVKFQDFAYYLAHRCIHEAGVFWSFHQQHHSSEYYNLSTALRQGFIQEAGTVFFECLQSVITPPPIFLTHKALNTLYQFWIHTEVIPKLGPLEYVLNTPSHHRVHHGRNPYCIDKNYAGVLIIWDRIFGTFEAERDDEKPAYGLIGNVKSFDALWLQLFEFKALGWDKGRMKNKKGEERFPGLWNKFKAAFGPPGWFPGLPTKQFFWWRCMEDPSKGIPKVTSV